MALNHSTGTAHSTQTHFQIRVGGLAGLLVGVMGLVLAVAGYLVLGIGLAIVGGGVAVTALVFELRTITQGVASRRSTAGAAVAIQVLLATFLVVELNAFSFFHYHRFDWTRDRQFTIPEDIRQDLAKLRGETTIVVYLSHNFGQLSDKRDEYDHSAERVVIDKVEDMVEQFREFGPQFRVTVLDVKDRRYHDKLKTLSADCGKLGDAIKGTKEDSIFVVAHDKVQRLGFQEIFQLDKKSSEKADGGRGNLVLHDQGVGPFARQILNLDNRKPRIAVAVVHEYLSMEGPPHIGMPGLKKALNARGFETRDILLTRGLERGNPQAVVTTYDENKYEKLQARIEVLDENIKRISQDLKELRRQLKRFQKASLEDLNKEFGKEFSERFGVKKIKEEHRREYIERVLATDIQFTQVSLDVAKRDRNSSRDQQKNLNVSEIAEQRRISDLKAKLDRKLADCDLLIIPRMTILNAAEGQALPNTIYQLDRAQVESIKDFMKRGKPVLFCFGPPTDRDNIPQDMFHGRSDGLEEYVAQLGIRFGKETILFTAERKSYAEKRGSLIFAGVESDVPQAEFRWLPGARLGRSSLRAEDELKPNPIAESMLLTVAGVDNPDDLDLRIRNPRPVYYEPAYGTSSLKVDPVFLMTDPTAWKEKNPFSSEGNVPRPENDRTGQLPIGVAVEASLPAPLGGPSHKVRVAGVGNGGIFIGARLSPIREKLAVDTCNWLLGREDLLAHTNDQPWSFPRVALSDSGKSLWLWGTRLVIPLFFLLLGIAVLLKRSLR